MTRYYEWNDLTLCAYLHAMGLTHSSSRKNDRGVMIFSFIQTDQLSELVKQYYSLNSQVNPQRFANALRSLKNLLYQNTNIDNNHGHYTNSRQSA